MSPRPPTGPGARNVARREPGADTYTLGEATALLGLTRSVIVRLVAAGYVKPARGPRGEYRFSFADMVLLRTARGLQAAQIPPRRILHSLRRLRESLPAQVPLTGLRIAAIGNEVVVRDGGAPWRADSGQLLFDFDVAPEPGSVHDLRIDEARRPTATQEVDWFRCALDLEASDASAAEAAYRRAIDESPGRADAYLNLGVLLGEGGRHAEAVAVYRQGLRYCPSEALLHFNLGVALEDLGQPKDAIAAYEHSLTVDANLADAHFNAARLSDVMGRPRDAIRHFNAYRRLQTPKR